MLVVGTAAVSEGAVALGIVGIGESAGGWDLRGLLILAASCVLLFGAVVFVGAAFIRLAGGSRLGPPAVALVTSALVVARYYSYDTYYAPQLYRVSQTSIIPGWWVALLAALSVTVAVLRRRSPPAAFFVTGVVMLAAAPTVFVAGLGH